MSGGGERDVCRECGDTKPLNADGVCAWRHGCEHRILRHEAAMARLEAEMQAVERRSLFKAGHPSHAFWLGYDLFNPLSFLDPGRFIQAEPDNDPDEGDT